MVDEHSDILGGHLQKAPPQSYKVWMAENPNITAVVAIVFTLLSYFVLIPALTRWQHQRYRKARRRRYGIPDDDERPFSIAHAAVRARTHEESEHGSRDVSEKSEGDILPVLRGHSSAPTHARHQLEGEDLSYYREPEVPHSASHVPYVSQYDPRQVVYNAWQTGPSTALAGDAVVRDYARTPARMEPDPSATISPGTLSNAIGKDASPPALKPHRKHARDDDEIGQPEKKSRLAGATQEVDEGIVVDGEDIADNMDVDVEAVQPKRGFKRQAYIEDDEGIEQVRASGRGKRARKVLREHSNEEMADFQVEGDEDMVAEMQPVQRGKKRDRDEAGSTFGGDESVADGAESDDGHKSRRRRKRRAMAKRVEDTGRGQKRVRDDASEESDEEPDRPKRRDTRRQRGSRVLDLFDSPLSNDALCRGRKIGEEWEVNGIHYKVGPNGQRLRQELIKRSRTRFPMPKDSAHPDRRTNIDVYVESWLTEEEYQAAKEHGDLAWQDSPTPSAPATPGDVSDFPLGKSLLWSSTSSTTDSPAPQRGPFSQSIVTNVGLRLDPFHHSQVPPRRRVTSVPQVPEAPITPEPSPSKPRTTKTYSKWEKQDLEAAAMARIRERKLAEAREAARTAPQGATQLSGAPSVTPSLPPAPAASPFMFANPAEKQADRPPPSAGDKPPMSLLSFGAPSVPAVPAPSASNSTPIIVTTPPKETPKGFFSTAPPPTSAPPPAKEAPKGFFSTAPPPTSAPPPATASTQQTSSIPNFFGNAGKTTSAAGQQASQPSNKPQTTPAAPAASAFGFGPKPATTTPAPTGGSSFIPFGAAGNPTQASATPVTSSLSAPKSAFSFAPPTAASKSAEQGATTSASAGPSLLARLGPQVPQSSAPQSQTNAPASSSALKFSFTQPSAPAAGGQQSAFVPSTPASASTAGAAHTSTTPAGTPAAASAQKFSFGFSGATPGSTAPAPTPAPSMPAAPAPAASGSANQGPQFSFAFAKPSTPASQPSGGGFGTSSQTPASTPTLSSAKTPAAFGFGAPSSNASNPFGAPSTSNSNAFTTPSKPTGANTFSTTPAGTPTSGSIFGGNSGSSTNVGPKAAPAFGAPSGTPTFGSVGSSVVQPVVSNPFGGVPSSSTPSTTNSGEAQSKPFSFNFGAAPSSSTTTSTTPPTGTSAFGATSQPTSTAFGFGNPSSTTPSASPFGPAFNTNQNQKQ